MCRRGRRFRNLEGVDTVGRVEVLTNHDAKDRTFYMCKMKMQESPYESVIMALILDRSPSLLLRKCQRQLSSSLSFSLKAADG